MIFEPLSHILLGISHVWL